MRAGVQTGDRIIKVGSLSAGKINWKEVRTRNASVVFITVYILLNLTSWEQFEMQAVYI